MPAGPRSQQPICVDLADGAVQGVRALQELTEATVMEMVAALAWPRDGIEVEWGAAYGAEITGKTQAGVWLRGMEAVGQPGLKEGVDPRGLVQVFLRRGSEVRTRLASLSPVLKPL